MHAARNTKEDRGLKMSLINWLEILGWEIGEIEDLRFVGYSYLKQGKYDLAITFFEALIVLSPDNPYDMQTLGAIYLEQGNHLMALNYLEKAVRLDPTHAATLLNRAKTLFALGYKKQAITQAKTLVANPDPYIANQSSALLLAYT